MMYKKYYWMGGRGMGEGGKIVRIKRKHIFN